MSLLLQLWTRALINPLLVFRVLASSVFQASRFNWWTSVAIYGVGYFCIFSFLLGFEASSLGGFIFLLALFLIIILGMVKTFIYTVFISQRTGTFIAYKDVLLLNTLSNIPILFLFPFLYALSFWVETSFIFLLVVVLAFAMLHIKRRLFERVYGVSTRFVYGISFTLWLSIFILGVFFALYIGISLSLLMGQILS